jgi:transposase
MRTPLRVRAFTAEEERIITKLARSQTASVRLVERAKILHLGRSGLLVPQIAQTLGLRASTVRKWFKRFEQQGLAGLEDAPRTGAPTHSTADQQAQVLAAARTRPGDLGLAYRRWTFERLADYVQKQLGIPMKKTRLFEVLQEEGLRWRKQETWFGERVDPDFAAKRGRSSGFEQSHPPTA